MIKANTPLELINGLSQRTINSLHKNKIFSVKDLFPYKDNILAILELPGIGENVIKELKISFKNIDGHGEGSLNNILLDTDDRKTNNKLELSPFFVYNGGNFYLNSLCYIVFSSKNSATKRLRNIFKRNLTTFFDLIGKENFSNIKSVGKSCLYEINIVKYKILDYYGVDNLKLYNCYLSKEIPFKQVDSLDLTDFITNYYNNLSELEKNIILNRENWFRNSSFSKLRELGKNNNMRGERIRQYGVLLNSDFDFYLKYYSHYFENYIENLLELHEDFEIRKFSEINEFSQFSYEFISEILSKIISSKYLYHKNDLSNTFFFLKKSKFGEIKNNTPFEKIDKIFYKEKKVERIETLYNITKHGLGKDVDKKIIKEFKPITKLYLEYAFNLKEQNNKIIFPVNKRDYPSLIINELSLCDKRIHFTKLYNKLIIKYPQYSRNMKTVHKVLQGSPKAVNVGQGLYIHKSKKPNSKGFQTIVEIIEKYLEDTKVKCATCDDIVKYVKRQKKVTDASIRSYLISNDKFTHIGGGIYGLNKNWEGKRMIQKNATKIKSKKIKNKSIIDIIEEYLEGKKDKCAPIDAIVKYVKSQRIASETYITHTVRDKTKNKNKFMRVGTGIFGLTKYWEGKPALQMHEISKIKSETKDEIKSVSIATIVEKYLEGLENHYATTDEIVKNVKNQKLISDKSIKEYIRSKDKNKNKIMRLGRGVYGLTSYWKGKSTTQIINVTGDKSRNTVNIIEEFLEKRKNKCATTNDIIRYVQKQKTISEETIRFCLYSKKKNNNKFMYIGELIYGLTKYWEGKPKPAGFDNITNIIEKCLEEKENKCASKQDIIKYVQRQKKLSEKTIIIYLTEKKRNKNKFINIGDGKYGLTKYWEDKPKLKGSESILDIIEKCLEERENKSATFDDIVRYVKKQRTASEHTIKRYLKTGKRNKNKFMRVGTGIFGLTKYREGKVM